MSDNKLIQKSEKYITERISKAGNHSLEICIRMNGQAFRKSIRMDEFSTPGSALSFAVKLRDEMLIKMRAGKKVVGLPTVRQLYEMSYEVLKPVALKTRKRHDVYFRACFEPFADIPIDKITAADIQSSLNKFAENHTTLETSKMFAVWRRLYRTCAMKELDVSDKSAAVQMPKGIQAQHRSKDITIEDLITFCDALLNYNRASVKGSYDCQAVYYLIQIMLYTGIRPAEGFALTRADINLRNNTIRINKAAHSTKTSLSDISTTKTERSARVIPIPDQLRPILIECLEWCRHDELLLARYTGDLLETSWTATLIGNVRKKCGIEFNLYRLRHMFSADLFAQNVPAPTIRDLMGHESQSMSLDYAYSDENARIKAINNRQFSKKNS